MAKIKKESDMEMSQNLPDTIEEESSVPEMREIERHAEHLGIEKSILEGTKAMMNWPSGKVVSEDELKKAAADFLGSPIGA